MLDCTMVVLIRSAWYPLKLWRVTADSGITVNAYAPGARPMMFDIAHEVGKNAGKMKWGMQTLLKVLLSNVVRT